MTTAERVNSDLVSDFDDRGTAFTTTEMSSIQAEELTRSLSQRYEMLDLPMSAPPPLPVTPSVPVQP